MSVQTVCMEPNRVLRERALAVDAFTDEVRVLVQDLIDTMYANDGIGLAAPQIGRSVRALVANPSQERGREVVVLNPVVEAARGRASIKEGCLSVPETWAHVKRAARVHLTGRDVSGRPVEIEADGLLAIVLQHEVDHLDGRLFIDRLSWWRRRRLRAASDACG